MRRTAPPTLLTSTRCAYVPQVRAYINENGEVGDAALQYMGAVALPKDGGDNQGVILDVNDEVRPATPRLPGCSPAPPTPASPRLPRLQPHASQVVGHVDYGRGLLQGPQGSTIAELRKGGEIRGHWGLTCGTLEGFDFHKLQTAAAYIMLVDRALVAGK